VNFQEAETYLYSLGNEVSAMKLGLDAMRTLLAALGDPQKKYLKVQIAGTNGKGSVCAFLDSICNTAGIKTGTFTSPHLVSITERVRINGVDISEEDFARHAETVREVCEGLVDDGTLETSPTFFEQVTAIALVAFAEAGVEVAILETGLGGRLDATTAANAEIAAITRIDLDHQEYLGNTIEEIAAEKAAIIGMTSLDVVLGKQDPAAFAVLMERAEEFAVDIRTGEGEFDWKIRDGTRPGYAKLDTNLISHPEFKLGLAGAHQIENAQIAVSVCQQLQQHPGIDAALAEDDYLDHAVFLGLQSARNPGRLEHQGRFLFDGAHNVGGARALAEYLREFETRPITLVFAAMRDKDVAEIAEVLFPLAERIVLTRPDNSRAMSADELAGAVPDGMDAVRTANVREAIETARAFAGDEGLILVTGSLYLVGEVKKLISDTKFEI
jgi:dihydrofolate synthase/folylpolyglutamate synthase